MLRQDQFLSIAALELRNPMHGLTLQLASAKAMARNAGATDVAEVLARVQGALTRYVDRAAILLDLARLESGHYPVASSTLDLTAFVRALVERLRNEAQFHGVALHYEGPAECPVETDPTLIEQILGNLIVNAFKHSGGDRVEVRLSQDASGRICVDVDDNGSGIPASERLHLFSEFGERRRLRSTAGFGLGLWIAREMSRALRATVSLEGKLGPGSMFRLTLPPALTPER